MVKTILCKTLSLKSIIALTKVDSFQAIEYHVKKKGRRAAFGKALLWILTNLSASLTQRGRGEGCEFHLAIPNLEVREIFTRQIMKLFKEDAKQDGKTLDDLCRALQGGDAEEAQRQLGKYLKKTISIRNTFAKKELKENFYHGMLLGLLAFKGSWVVSSNREAAAVWRRFLWRRYRKSAEIRDRLL